MLDLILFELVSVLLCKGKNNLGQGRVYLAYRSLWEGKTVTQNRNFEAGTEAEPISYWLAFFVRPWIACPGVAPATEGYLLPFQLLIKKTPPLASSQANLIEAILQMGFSS